MFLSNRCALSCAALLGALWVVPGARAAEAPPDIARGQHIADAVAHCEECHGTDFGGGRAFPTGPGGAKVVASNLTSGAGGVGGAYADADFARAIRLGVRPDGTHLAVMPSRDFVVLTDADTASLIAYIRSVPPVERSVPHDSSASAVPVVPHKTAGPSARSDQGVPAASPLPGMLSEGAYLARVGSCLDCHGADLHGSNAHGFSAPDISHGGIGTWSFADFSTAMRSGRTPAGETLGPPMPWRAIGHLTDAELEALYHFLEAAPAATSPASAG